MHHTHGVAGSSPASSTRLRDGDLKRLSAVDFGRKGVFVGNRSDVAFNGRNTQIAVQRIHTFHLGDALVAVFDNYLGDGFTA